MKRNSNRRSLRRRILVVTEDTVSSNKYIEQIRIYLRLPEANVKIVPGTGSDPVSVIETAVFHLRRDGPFDRVFVVIDRDSHANFQAAIQKLRQYNGDALVGTRRIRKWTTPAAPEPQDRFELVLSVPCFEYWILLHFVYQRAAFLPKGGKSVCDVVIDEVKKPSHMPHYRKGMRTLWTETSHLYAEVAKVNALRSSEDSERTGRPNPSTNLHIVIDELMRMELQAG